MNFDKWLRGGDIPVCFADADVSKHHTMFKGVEVLPLLEAVSKHSDYEIYCTQSAENLQEVPQDHHRARQAMRDGAGPGKCS